MKPRSVLTVLVSAAMTVAVTLALALPRDNEAQAAPAVRPVIAKPELKSQGCTFTVKTDRTEYEAGQAPVIEVAATNPTDQAAKAKVWVAVTATAPTDPRLRMLPIPRTLWSHEFAFGLEPRETKSLTATCDAALPAGQAISITLSDQKTAVTANAFGVPAQGNPNVPVPARNGKR